MLRWGLASTSVYGQSWGVSAEGSYFMPCHAALAVCVSLPGDRLFNGGTETFLLVISQVSVFLAHVSAQQVNKRLNKDSTPTIHT